MMGPDFLRTKVAGRVLALFFVGAIVPVVFLQMLSFGAVSDLLERQSEDRLLQLADATVQIIHERLASSTSWVESAGVLALGAAAVGGGDVDDAPDMPGGLAPALSGVAIEDEGRMVAIVGAIAELPGLAARELDRVRSGAVVLKTSLPEGGGDASLHLAMPAPPSARGVMWARLRADSVWASAMVLGAGPRVSDMCVLDADMRPFACKTGPASDLPRQIRTMTDGGLQGLVRFDLDGEPHVAAWKRVYLRSAYGASDWMVAASEAESSVHAPVASFAYNLPLALAVGLGLVLLLANFLVRRTMEPLEKLAAGTERIARHDLSARVDVRSEDEFGELASSFNTMAERLSLQFAQIEAARAIDRAVIEDNSATNAIDALIGGVEALVASSRCSVLLVEDVYSGTTGFYRRKGEGRGVLRSSVSPGELLAVDAGVPGGHAVLRSGEVPGVLLEGGWGGDGRSLLLVRMTVQDTDIGFVAVEAGHEGGLDDVDVDRARQLVAQAGVALNENRLRRELVELSGETLRALANAIDAKSRWTTGHSERVTDLARAIGRRLGLGVAELETLHRGGLLHDVGKIGVSSDILDRHGSLSAAERRAVEAHTTIGARILEPVRVFEPLLGIVLHHHERWDGKGYPHGLAGTDIPFLARIVAVADVFDALASPRPYRQALSMDVVIRHIRAESERAFDPECVEAFDEVIGDGWVHEVPPPASLPHDR